MAPEVEDKKREVELYSIQSLHFHYHTFADKDVVLFFFKEKKKKKLLSICIKFSIFLSNSVLSNNLM